MMHRRKSRAMVQRRGLGDLFSDIFDGGSSSSATTTGGLLDGLVPTISIPAISIALPSGLLPTLTTSTPLTTSSSSASSSSAASSATSSSVSATLTSASASSSATSTSVSSTSSSSSSATSTSSSSTTTSPTPTTTSATSTSLYTSMTVYETTSGGHVHTVTVVASAPATTSSGAAATPAAKSFLQNKPLSGAVFALVGIIGLILIISIGTFAVRRRQKNRLNNEALSFDPNSVNDATGGYSDGLARVASTEKGRASVSSSGHSHGAAVPAETAYGGYTSPVMYAPPQQQQQQQQGMYARGQGQQQGYTQSPYQGPPVQVPGFNQNSQYPTYAARSPNPVYDAARAHILPPPNGYDARQNGSLYANQA